MTSNYVSTDLKMHGALAGADGCRTGWMVAVADDPGSAERARLFVVPDFGAVLDAVRGCAALAVDMPIGLPPGGEARDCDLLARRRLAALSRGVPNPQSRVFPTPPRPALRPGDDYAAFARRVRELTGRAPSRQLFGIAPRILEVDALMTPALQRRVAEAHPELCFARLAGRTLHSKHTPLGAMERGEALGLTARSLAGLLARCAIPAALSEDALDALALLGAAAHVAAHADGDAPTASRLPETAPPRDERGLRMEMWF